MKSLVDDQVVVMILILRTLIVSNRGNRQMVYFGVQQHFFIPNIFDKNCFVLSCDYPKYVLRVIYGLVTRLLLMEDSV